MRKKIRAINCQNEEDVLAALEEHGPLLRRELFTMSHGYYQRHWETPPLQILQDMVAAKKIKHGCFPGRIKVYYLPKYKFTDADFHEYVMGRCVKTIDECLLYKGTIHKVCGPVYRNKPLGYSGTVLRRFIWDRTHRYSKLAKNEAVRMTCGHENCLNPDCMEKYNFREICGRLKRNPIQKLKNAKIRRAELSKFTAEQVQHIRRREKTATQLAEEYQCNVKTIYNILRHRTWKEYTGFGVLAA